MSKIAYADRRYKKEEVLKVLNRFVAKWFDSKFDKLTPPQSYGIIPIYQGKNVLISSPTGTGKTLTAFLSIISKLFDLAQKGELEDRVYCIYVSPLRALNNDIYRNLEEPLREIREIIEKEGLELPEIRHVVRTGDTPPHEKQKMLRKPPHILITTPESLAIILNAPKFKKTLTNVEYVIVDEIHSLAESKRGVHLTLSLERLQELSERHFARIGLSATINPLEEVAQFLVGFENGEPRPCIIVDTRYVKKKNIKVLCPVSDLIHTPSDIVNRKMYELLADLIRRHRTTLIFTNTRSGTERVVFHLKQVLPKNGIEDFGEESIAAHHGSLSRYVRHGVEEKLKKGLLRVIVSSTSLELGIDIGYIDLVVQIGSPKSVTRCLQRIGRSGHKLHEVSKGRLVCVDRDDIVECSVMVKEAYRGHLDKIRIPKNCLDVLAQHILGMAIEKKWSVDEAYRLVKRSYCYKDLSKENFLRVLQYLSGNYSVLERYRVYGKIWFDPEEGVFGRRGKYARVIYALNIGTIPDEVSVKVFTVNGRYVGNIEEEFLERLMPGDRFILGGKVYEFVKSRGFRAYVKPAFDMKPTVPSWFSEMLPLSFDLGLKIGEFRRKMFKWLEEEVSKDKILMYIKKYCHTDDNSANSIYEYFLEEYLYLRYLGINDYPSDKVILVEYYLSDEGKIYQVHHTLYGRKVNDALSRALGYLASKKAKRNIGIAVHDNGFALIYPPGVKPKFTLKDIKSSELRQILAKAIRNTEMFKRRFRHVAARGLMILRNYKGHEISVNKQQLNANTLLKVVEDLEEFPLLKETYREIMEDVMDVENAEKVLKWIEKGKIKVVELSVQSVPSPFAHNIVLEGLSDVVLMEDKRALIERFHKAIMDRVAKLAPSKVSS
ncbi:MAG: ATP-dependent helicase [Thermoprotei archaeon]|nr:MAG: ATP-dependent helicase [Thermoprotei archaeon]